MNRKQSKTFVLPRIYYLICIIIAVQEIEMKEEEEQRSVVYAAAASTLSSDFNFAAVGDWGDNSETIKTAQNIDTKNVEVVLGLGDYAYEKNSNGIRSWWNNIEMVHDDEIFKGALAMPKSMMISMKICI